MPAEGEVLVRNVFVSVDPYMRGRMNGRRHLRPPSRSVRASTAERSGGSSPRGTPGFAQGDWVLSQLGWRDQGVVSADRVRKLDPTVAPPSTALGVLGMPGFTAWVGLLEIGQVRSGETIYVRARRGRSAARSVRSRASRAAGDRQRRQQRQGRVAPLARGRSVQLQRDRLRGRRSPDGIDAYFDNVGGDQDRRGARRATHAAG